VTCCSSVEIGRSALSHATNPATKLLANAGPEGHDFIVTRGFELRQQGKSGTAFFCADRKKYEGTRLGRQELMPTARGYAAAMEPGLIDGTLILPEKAHEAASCAAARFLARKSASRTARHVDLVDLRK